jgi:hypothetical protein
MRPKAILKPGRCCAARHNPRSKAFRVHGLGIGSPDQIDTRLRQIGEVGRQASRIRLKVLMRRELGRINEYRDDDAIGATLRGSDQSEVSGMKCAHGRHQRGRASLAPKILNRALERRQGTNDARAAFERVAFFAIVVWLALPREHTARLLR